MQTLLIRCLIINIAVLLGSGALLLWYPKESGFTITSADQTNYFQGGVFLSAVLICLSDLVIAAYLGWRPGTQTVKQAGIPGAGEIERAPRRYADR